MKNGWLAMLAALVATACAPDPCSDVFEAKAVAIDVLDADTERGVDPDARYELEAMAVGVHESVDRVCQWSGDGHVRGCFSPATMSMHVEAKEVVLHETVHAYVWLHNLSISCAGSECVVDADPRHLRPEWDLLPTMLASCGF